MYGKTPYMGLSVFHPSKITLKIQKTVAISLSFKKIIVSLHSNFIETLRK